MRQKSVAGRKEGWEQWCLVGCCREQRRVSAENFQMEGLIRAELILSPNTRLPNWTTPPSRLNGGWGLNCSITWHFIGIVTFKRL